VVRLSTRFLVGHGSLQARLEAELLIAHSLGMRRLDLYLQHERTLREQELVPLRALLRRRAKGEPVAYLSGTREFYGRAFTVTPAVLIPRPETELVVERALRWMRERAAPGTAAGEDLSALDLGTGSGCIAVSLALEAPGLRVLASDLCPGALAVAATNAGHHGVRGRVRLLAATWWAALAEAAAFDLIVTNPPYVTTAEMSALMPDVRDFEPRGALEGGADGLAAYREILDGAPRRLRPGGACLLEIDPRRSDAVTAMARDAWPHAQIDVHADLGGALRVVEVWLPR